MVLEKGRCANCGKYIEKEFRKRKKNRRLFCTDSCETSFNLRKRGIKMVEDIHKNPREVLDRIKEKEGRIISTTKRRPFYKMVSVHLSFSLAEDYEKFLDYIVAEGLSNKSQGARTIVNNFLSKWKKESKK